MILHNGACAEIMAGDCLESLRSLPDAFIHTCVTSPPYFGLRDYGATGQIGLEETPDAYVARLVEVFREVRRVLRDDGTLWLNLGDSYFTKSKGSGGTSSIQKNNAGSLFNTGSRFNVGSLPLKEKDLIGIPWRVAFALQADGWYLRQDIIWHKPNPMPESVTDRCTKAHEYIFMLSKSARYYYETIKEPAVYPGDNRAKRYDTRKEKEPLCVDGGSRKRTGKPTGETRNKRDVWTVATKPFKGAHFATFPPDLIEPCILAGCPPGGVVLDPFGGSGTTAGVALKHGRNALLCELNPEYAAMIPARVQSITG